MKLSEKRNCHETPRSRPAIAGDRLLLRTSARLYCIQKQASK